MPKLLKSLVAATLVLLSTFALPVQFAGAQADFFRGCESAPNTEFCKQTAREKSRNRILGSDGILTRVARYITFVTGAISVILVIVGGLRYVISGGDSNGIKTAKDTIIYALVGLVISIFAYAIAAFVLSRF